MCCCYTERILIVTDAQALHEFHVPWLVRGDKTVPHAKIDDHEAAVWLEVLRCRHDVDHFGNFVPGEYIVGLMAQFFLSKDPIPQFRLL